MNVDRRAALLAMIAAGAATRLPAQTPLPRPADPRPALHDDPAEVIDLWPGLPPGSPAPLPVETVRERSTDPAYHDRAFTGIGRPRMAVFRPARPNGGAVLITPGGAYERVVIDKEGFETARFLAARGITAFVLFYRLPRDGWTSGADTPLADAQRAMRLIRHRASEFGIAGDRIAAIGFSAGGHVAASLATRFAAPAYEAIDAADALPARPDAAAFIYPVIAMAAPAGHRGSRDNLLGRDAPAALERRHSPHLNVPADAPPAFLLHAEDDSVVPVDNSLLMRRALLDRGIAVDTHLFPDGGHGFGLRLAAGRSVAGWEEILHRWLAHRGIGNAVQRPS